MGRNDLKRNDFEKYKDAYTEKSMSELDVQKMKNRIEQAKQEKKAEQEKQAVAQKTNQRNTARKWYAVAAAAAIIIAVPNLSPNAAYAMEKIPVLGNLFRIVTFRDYTYEDEKHSADVHVPEIQVETEQITDLQVKENVIKSSAQINEKIKELAEEKIAAFEKEKDGEGFHDLQITSEVMGTTDGYFTLKLVCFEAMASGYEEHHYFTIDLETGKELKLKDMFWENTDYIHAISENIKEQMKAQMAEDENKIYWIDSDMPEMDFQEITEDTEFYINEDGKLVISFNEYEVAPGYMGCVEFVINSEAVDNMKKPAAATMANVMQAQVGNKEISLENITEYDQILEKLPAGTWYAQVQLETAKHPILLVSENVYDNGDGTMASIYADLFAYNEEGKIVKYGTLESTGTAYPLAASENFLFQAGNHHVSKVYVGEDYSAMLTKEDAVETFDKDGNAYYYYFSIDDGYAGAVEDESRLYGLFDEMAAAEVISFTEKK